MKFRFSIAIALTALLASATGALAASTGKIVYYTNIPDNGAPTHYQISIINGDGTGNTRLNRPTDDFYPELSPDGSKIAFVVSGTNGISLMNPDGTGAALIPNTDGCSLPSWSADGTKLAALCSAPAGRYLATFNVDGTGFRSATTFGYALEGFDPALSPDGTKIVFDAYARDASGHATPNRIYIVNADGASAPVRISTDDNANYRQPSWSPDGTKIVCQKAGTVYTLNPVTGAETRVTPVTATGGDSAPWFSPDGTQISYQDVGGSNRLGVMNLDGTNRRVYNTTQANSPKWSRAAPLPPPVITSPGTASGTVGVPFSFQITATNNPTQFFISGLPQGLSLNAATGLISGTPQVEVTADLSVLARGPGGDSAWTDLKITIGPETAPTPPPHGGLSATTLKVNGSADRAGTLSGPVLSFVALQGGTPAKLALRVQSSTTPEPNDGTNTSWTDLPTATKGRMAFDKKTGKFFLNTTAYPARPGLFFRVIASAAGYPNSISNYVGSFDGSTGGSHLPPVLLLFKRNGTLADLSFLAGAPNAPAGTLLRIQASQTPAVESSWTDLGDGNAGRMARSAVGNFPDVFILLTNKVPPGGPYYFRAVAQASGYLDSLSNVVGAYTITADTPPVTKITPPAHLSGSGTENDPYVVLAGQLRFSADATPDPSRPPSKITELKVLLDGKTITTAPGAPAFVDFRLNVTGAHVLEAAAIDDLGGTSRGGTGLVYLNVVDTGDRPQAASRADGAAVNAASSSGRTFTAVTSGGLWSDPTTWRDTQGNNGVPGPNDFAKVGSNNGLFIKIGQPTTVRSLLLNGGAIFAVKDFPNPPTDLTVTGMMTVSVHGGDLFNLHLVIPAGATFESLNNELRSIFTGSVDNYGAFNLHGSKGIASLRVFNNRGTSNFQIPPFIPPDAGRDPTAESRVLSANSVLGAGILIGANPNSLLAQSHLGLVTLGGNGVINGTGSGVVSNDGGSLISQDGGSLISQDGGGLLSQDGGGLISQDGGGLLSQDGGGLVGKDGSRLVASGAGNLVASGAGNLTGSGASARSGTAAAPTSADGYDQISGETDLNAVTLFGPVTLDGGTLSGSGIIQGDLTNNGGYLSPGHSAGAITVAGAFSQGANGTLLVEAGGATSDQFDQLLVTGAVSLGGKLDVKLINGFTPDPADTVNPLAFGSASGSFASVSANAQVSLGNGGLLVSANPAIAGPSYGQPANISTRMKVLTGDKVLIGGFIVQGPAGSTKAVLIRGKGPSLAAAGLAGVLNDPVLQLFKPDGSSLTNDNWQTAPNQDRIPDGFAPTDPRESLIIADLAPGNYTVIERGADGGSGIGLTEIYDIDGSRDIRLANISTRGFVDTGDNVLIGGFIVTGSEPAGILVRATGPSLSGVLQGVLQDPELELHDSNGNVFTNDNWRETQETEIIATTVQPANDLEPAIVATLVPGNYTAIVRGKDGGTGIGLVEVYKVK